MTVHRTSLTHLGRVTSICVTELSHNWFRQWLVTCSVPSRYLNQYLYVVKTHIGTNFSDIWIKIRRYRKISIQKYELENVVWKIATICPGLSVLSIHTSFLKLFSEWHRDLSDTVCGPRHRAEPCGKPFIVAWGYGATHRTSTAVACQVLLYNRARFIYR